MHGNVSKASHGIQRNLQSVFDETLFLHVSCDHIEARNSSQISDHRLHEREFFRDQMVVGHDAGPRWRNR